MLLSFEDYVVILTSATYFPKAETGLCLVISCLQDILKKEMDVRQFFPLAMMPFPLTTLTRHSDI